jgi:hypothetical protein
MYRDADGVADRHGGGGRRRQAEQATPPPPWRYETLIILYMAGTALPLPRHTRPVATRSGRGRGGHRPAGGDTCALTHHAHAPATAPGRRDKLFGRPAGRPTRKSAPAAADGGQPA